MKRVLVVSATIICLASAIPFLRKHTVTPIPLPDVTNLRESIRTPISDACKSVERDRKSPTEWGRLGKLYLVHGFSPEAMECFQNASRLEPASPEWFYFQAVIEEERDLQASEKLYRQVLAINDAAHFVRYRLAGVLERLGESKAATEEFRKVASTIPSHPAPHLSLGRMAIATGNWQNARAELQAAHLLAPQSRQIRLEMARVEAGVGNWSEAMKLQSEARLFFSVDPTLDDPWMKDLAELESVGQSEAERADQLLAIGRLEQAIAILRKLADEHPELHRARLNLAIALGQTGNLPESQRVFSELATAFPSDALTYLAWGRLLGSLGRFKESQSKLLAAIDRKNDCSEAYELLGLLAERQGETEKAKEWYELAIQSSPNSETASLSLAALYDQLGEKNEAERVRDRVSKIRPPNRSH